MTEKVRRILDQIEDVLLVGDEEARDLVAIIAALRGPDQEDDGSLLKSTYTIPIRRAAFPRLAAAHDKAVTSFGFTWHAPQVGWDMRCVSTELKTFSATDPLRHEHFPSHINSAVEALTR